MISTRDLSGLPSMENLKRLTQSLAMLDAIVEPNWEYRYFSFNTKWSANGQMAPMRNQQGDEWYCLFTASWAALKGFAHESKMSPYNRDPFRVWPGVLDSLPDGLSSFAAEPAFSMQDTTFCIWRTLEDSEWRTGHIDFPDGTDPDGSESMRSILDGRPSTYPEWAEGYYERNINSTMVANIYGHEPLTSEIVRTLNPDIALNDALKDAEEIGYPADIPRR
jgi:hypothetical protein